LAKSKELELAIKIAGEVEKSFMNSTKLTKKELQSIARTAAQTSSGIKNTFSGGINELNGVFDAMSSGAKKAFDKTVKAATLAAATIAGVATAAIVVGSGFESAFAGVKKTVDATDAELEQLEKSIRDMAKNMPMTAEEIAGIAEAAGQLGIETANIASFTKTMADLGVATNLTSEDAATQFARFANITGMSQNNFDRLGSSVVALGNNLATTESEITAMAMRLAGAGSQVNMSESQILGFAAALSSVGIEAEAGGSALSKVMVNMQLAVETGLQSWEELESEMKISGVTMMDLKNALNVGGNYLKKFAMRTNYSASQLRSMYKEAEKGVGGLEDYAKVAGMTAREFQDAFKKDAAGAMISFITGLSNVERNGMSAIAVLDSMDIKEVRLRDTLLRASNAGNLFADSLDIANGAWEENNALTNEAAQRYATFESKIEIFKNVLKDLGISIYQDLREPLAYGVGAATEFVKSFAGKVDSKNVIGDLVKSFTRKLPTAIRKVKEFNAAFLDFADPLLKVGKWLIQNPNVVVSTIAGIGATIASYKVAQRINSLVKGFTSLAGVLTNPFAATIFAVGLAIGGAAGLAVYINNLNKEMAKQNLAEHFGDIALSMEELEEAAKHIVGTNYFGQIENLMSSKDLSEGFLRAIRESTDEINKTHWKLAVGLEISDNDLASYADSVTQYVQNAQDYITNQGYTVEIATKLLLGTGGSSDALNAENNAFYAELSTHVSELSEELSKIMSEALESGLTIDTEKKVAELLSQIDEITTAVSQAESNARLQVIEAKFSGKELDAETFQNLQAEIASYTGSVIEGANLALQESLKSINAQLDLGYITQAEYDTKYDAYMQGYYQTQADAILKGNEFMKNTIMDTYGSEIEPAIKAVEESISKNISEIMTNDNWWNTYSMPQDWANGLNNVLLEAMYSTDLSKAAKNAISMLVEGMAPNQEQLENLAKQIKATGGIVPQGIIDAMTDTETYAAITGSEDELWKKIGFALGESKEYSTVIETAAQQGGGISQSAIDAMREKQPEAEQTARDLLDSMKNAMGEGFDVFVPIGVTYKTTADYIKNGRIPGYASGGIITEPTLATFAEKVPEAAIPLDGSNSSIGLWKTVGKLLGVYSGSSNEESFGSLAGGTQERPESFKSLLDRILGKQSNSSGSKTTGNGSIVYSPVLNFYGGTPSKEDIVDAGRISQDEFDEKMEYWISQNDRLSFE
jgi:uncharacterized protein YukE